MNAQVLINPNATFDLGRADFRAADLAERATRRAAITAGRRELTRSYEAAEAEFLATQADDTPADRAEARQQIDNAQHLVTLIEAATRKAEETFAPMERAGFTRSEPDFAELLADVFAERFTDKALARVFLASVRLGVA